MNTKKNSNCFIKNPTTLIIRNPKRERDDTQKIQVEIGSAQVARFPNQLDSVIGHKDIAHNHIFPCLFARILTRFENLEPEYNLRNTHVINLIGLMYLAMSCKVNFSIVINYIRELANDYINNHNLFIGRIDIANGEDGVQLLLLKIFGHQHQYSRLVVNNYLLDLERKFVTPLGRWSAHQENNFENLTLKNFKRILQVMNVKVTEVLNLDDFCKKIINNPDSIRQNMHIRHLAMLARNGFFESQPDILAEIINYALTIRFQSALPEDLISMVSDFAKAGLLIKDDLLVNNQLFLLAQNILNNQVSIEIIDDTIETIDRKQVLAALGMIRTFANKGLLNHTNHQAYTQLVVNNYLLDLERRFISKHDSINYFQEYSFENDILKGFKRVLQEMDVNITEALNTDYFFSQITNNPHYKSKCMQIKHLGMLAKNGFFESPPAILDQVLNYALTINSSQQPEAVECLMKMIINFANEGLLVNSLINNQCFFMVQPILAYRSEKSKNAKLQHVALEMISALAGQGLINHTNHQSYSQLFTNNYLLELEAKFIGRFHSISKQEENDFENITLKEFKRILEVMNVNITEVFNMEWCCEQITNNQDDKNQCMHIKHLSMLAKNGFCNSRLVVFNTLINYASTIDLIQQSITAEYLIKLITDFTSLGLLNNSYNIQDFINNQLLFMVNKIFSHLLSNEDTGNCGNLQFPTLEMISALANQGLLNNFYQYTRYAIINIFSLANEIAKNDDVDHQWINTIHDIRKAGLLQNNSDFEPFYYPNLHEKVILTYYNKIDRFINTRIVTSKKYKKDQNEDEDSHKILIQLVSVLWALNPNKDISEIIIDPIKNSALALNPNTATLTCIKLVEVINVILNAGLLNPSSTEEIINIVLFFLEMDLKSAQKLKVPALTLLHNMVIWKKQDMLTIAIKEQARIKQVSNKYFKSQVKEINAWASSILKVIQ